MKKFTEYINENLSNIELPKNDGWYWIESYGEKTPCWFMTDAKCFLPGGMGDSSSTGIFLEDINKIGPKIIEPEF